MSASLPSLEWDACLSAVNSTDYVNSYFTSPISVYTRKFAVVTNAGEDGLCSFCEITSHALAFHSDAKPPTALLVIGECPQKKANVLHGRLVREKDRILLLGRDAIWQQTGQWDQYEVEIS